MGPLLSVALFQNFQPEGVNVFIYFIAWWISPIFIFNLIILSAILFFVKHSCRKMWYVLEPNILIFQAMFFKVILFKYVNFFQSMFKEVSEVSSTKSLLKCRSFLHHFLSMFIVYVSIKSF